MGYRCFIDFVNEKTRFYNHFNGYPFSPDGIGILTTLSHFYKQYNKKENIITEISKYNELNNLELELYYPDKEQSDIEYYYLVYQKKSKLHIKCYDMDKMLLFNLNIYPDGSFEFLPIVNRCIRCHVIIPDSSNYCSNKCKLLYNNKEG